MYSIGIFAICTLYSIESTEYSELRVSLDIAIQTVSSTHFFKDTYYVEFFLTLHFITYYIFFQNEIDSFEAVRKDSSKLWDGTPDFRQILHIFEESSVYMIYVYCIGRKWHLFLKFRILLFKKHILIEERLEQKLSHNKHTERDSLTGKVYKQN